MKAKLSDQVKDFIKKQIERGELKFGDRINEKEICSMLGLSRTPVREALLQLGNEGIVDIEPRKSIRVKKYSFKDIKNIHTIISKLDTDAAVFAVDKLTPSDISLLEKLYQGMKKALEQNDFNKYMDLNLQSHDLYLQKTDNDILIEILDRLKSRMASFPIMMYLSNDWLERTMMSDHYNLIHLFIKKDKAGVKKLIKEHWNYNRIYSLIKSGDVK